MNRILFVVLFAASSISHALVQLEIPGAYKYFAAKHQIPADVLFAVCLQESGKRWQDKHLPWPWTLNIAGKGAYYDTPADAHRQLLQIINGGSCRVDIGLCQVHWCAHKKNFTAPAQLLNPYINLAYAAKLIRSEYDYTQRKGNPDWWIAVGRYHSPGNPKLASQYRERVKARWQRRQQAMSTLTASIDTPVPQESDQ
ncbi:MAG: lytic transglycosylase domain-containing protein [Cellvibrio sp.]